MNMQSTNQKCACGSKPGLSE